MKRAFTLCLALLALLALLVLGRGTARADAPAPLEPAPGEDAFLRDLTVLTEGPHRLAGSAHGARAALHIERRLRDLGLSEVYLLDMPVWLPETRRCELEIDGVVVPLAPLRSNVIIPPVTAGEGVEAPLVYAGAGEAVDYGERSPAGKIVVLEYDSHDAWERAFSLGARAVVFVGRGGEQPLAPKHAEIPLNQLRFYVAEADRAGVDLQVDRARARIRSEVVWERRTGRNVIARVKGTEPSFAGESRGPEAVVLAAPYDSFGVVPERSPGARAAANAAVLLEAASSLRARPPRRDVILMFLDNQAHAHQGAREVYDALMTGAEQAEAMSRQTAAELAEIEGMLRLSSEQGLSVDRSVSSPVAGGLAARLAAEANFIRDDRQSELSSRRLDRRDGAAERALEEEGRRWDEIRRALHQDSLPVLVARERRDAGYSRLFTELQQRTRDRLSRRKSELIEVSKMVADRARLRAGLRSGGAASAPPWIALHVSLDLGDGSERFGVVVGNGSERPFAFRQPKPDGDSPGYYGRVLNAFAAAAQPAELPHLSRSTLSDPSAGALFAPGPYVSSGSVAGAYGIYNVALMTGYDARPRDGHPADSVAALDWRRVRTLGREGTELVRLVASSRDLSLPRVFKPYARSKYPVYEDGRSSGDYAGIQVSGSLKENRPAAGALVALWPGNVGWVANAWVSRKDAGAMPGHDPTLLEAVDERGHFRIVGVREDMFTEVMAFGALFDEQGLVRAVSTREQQAQKLASAIRANLIFASAHGFTQYRTYETAPDRLKLLKASNDAEFRNNRANFGGLDQHAFAYVSLQVPDFRLKVFQPMGPVALGEFTSRAPFGTGVAPSALVPGLHMTQRSATDLYQLNERRLSELRARGVTSADLEILHGRARQAIARAEKAAAVADREAHLQRSAALSQRVYAPLRVVMDDLVHAIVVLLILAVPFAFALERLTFCSTTVYGRIAGFASWFAATFVLLYLLHPGFSIAATPAIVLLAFAIVLLSGLVIHIVVRKFRHELGAMQGRGGGAHDLGVSRAGTLLAAIGMGMSTMRRRPTRTTLTAITVVVLTFTILCFASFSRTVGVRAVYEGPPAEGGSPGILLRKLDYSAILPGVLDMLHGQEGEGGALSAHYWLTRTSPGSSSALGVAVLRGESLAVDAVLGVPPSELERSPALARAFGQSAGDARRALAEGGVYLPSIVAQVLRVSPGDEVLLSGRRVRFAGAFDSGQLQRMKQIDGESLLPVDFRDASAQTAGGAQRDSRARENELLLADEVDRDFVHLSADQVVVASSELVRSLGGQLHVISIRPGEGVDVAERARRLAEVVVMPVWAAGPAGVERLLLTVLTEVSGGFALAVPLLLGGLIIFGTLLGSISDREREIYTFSALGLSPGHVGMLFFAEALVYAVVGGMGGQLLAELVGVAQAALARAGYVEPVSINFSSTNSLFAIAVVMLTVLVSAVYPAVRASRSANPGLSRAWKLPAPEGDRLALRFPFTVSAYDVTAVLSFLAEHFRRHDDAGLGEFAASNVSIGRASQGNLELRADLALAPFDLGVTQHLELTAVPSEIQGVDEIAITLTRATGSSSDWHRQNRVFVRGLRRQFLVFRTLSSDAMEAYRRTTLEALGGVSTEGT